jgi:hypothetical protein
VIDIYTYQVKKNLLGVTILNDIELSGEQNEIYNGIIPKLLDYNVLINGVSLGFVTRA